MGVTGCGEPVLLTKPKTFKQTRRKLKTKVSMIVFCEMPPAPLGSMGRGGKTDL